jgi:hypothetical protein
MCGEIKFEHRATKLGQPLICVGSLTASSEHIWSGFARRESLEFWRRWNVEKVDLLANFFQEKNLDFTVPTGKIWGLLLHQNVLLQGRIIGYQDSVRIITRAAISDFEKYTHSRWPMVGEAKNPCIWTEATVCQMKLL